MSKNFDLLYKKSRIIKFDNEDIKNFKTLQELKENQDIKHLWIFIFDFLNQPLESLELETGEIVRSHIERNFIFKSLKENFLYLKLRNFEFDYDNFKEEAEKYLNNKELIIDLRDNEGGDYG